MKPFIHPLARPHRLAAVLLCAATLSLSACGGDSNDGTPGTGTDAGTTQPDQPGKPPADKPNLRCAP
ncbi:MULTISPECIES: hypothetical protein [Ralstonia]|uniref:Lipoprotein n=1 Tax=Ralstonia mannitolilytica TaxID=105219 RepID=A0AAD2AUH4_9RALS|nr:MULTISPECIES: hypothetical protein [Ralstonia]AJW44372.1 hypothetical protein TK49_06385 [Ralstonia mannitolilytica]MBU9577627.1 hypothetical protein [Ralstonia mannitolilytica]MBY4720533.1 hypothetical protein [Ralstonia mannitolilytica]PLT20125.1 hypothetical protein CXP34_09430 [Ralstonia mannitolilytica]QIF08454.1 hypothetical protein G5A69_12900 [Ralstonia mannitolilytica]